MLLSELVATSQRVAETRSRRAKIDTLAACLRRFAPGEIGIGVDFLCGATRQTRLGIGDTTIREAFPATALEAAELSLHDVDETLSAIAATSGAGSAAERRCLLARLLGRATVGERDFLVRLLMGELRQGALESIVADAVAQAAGVPTAALRRAVMLAGSLAPVARAVLVQGEAALGQFSMRLFQPLQPMLAQSAEDVADALARLGTAALEWKLDGARVQVHKSGDEVRIFTRSLNDVTVAAPEIAEAVRDLPARAIILDGETIALRPDGSPQPFQTTMRRFGRRLDVERLCAELPLAVFFFDCLRVDAQDLVDAPAQQRFAALADALPRRLIVPRLITADANAARQFFDDALARGHEGVMAKALDAAYEAGNRGSGWLKVKRANTLDLVVLAAEWGSGRRRGWLSNLHLGARDPATGGFVMLGKTFKGLTDETLAWQTRELIERELLRDAYTVHVKPELVVEVACNEIQTSSRYPGGVALRFARVKRYRPDKRAEDADTIATVRALHARQGGS